MRSLIKNIKILFFCIVFAFSTCNAMSVNVETFYRNMREGKVVPVALCNEITVEVLKKISALTVQKTALDEPSRIVSIGTDEDCPMTAEEELDGEIASHMDILQNVDKVLHGREREGDEVTALQAQLMEIFRVYSECDPAGFQKSCQDALVKLNP